MVVDGEESILETFLHLFLVLISNRLYTRYLVDFHTDDQPFFNQFNYASKRER